ncbi:MAG: hypothetical protein AW07_03553 [Candidatus Accumulibacter sp. SK-11]|nr:MAG: hypothetical protein AW07_03553 [Candidatus Accumulibacter sp. SK-11]
MRETVMSFVIRGVSQVMTVRPLPAVLIPPRPARRN